MAVIAVTMVKNEADVIDLCIRHMAAQVDHVIVADNGSSDGTRELLDELPCEVIDDPDPAYYQSKKMTALAHYAGRLGADWIVPFDGDEIWLSQTHGSIREVLDAADGFEVAPAWVYDHVVTDTDPVGIAPQQAMVHRMKKRTPLHKVAARYAPNMVIQMGNHQVTYDRQLPKVLWGALEVRHFPIRSPQQYLRKATQGAAALALTDLDYTTGQHWRDWNQLVERNGQQALADAFLDHWYYRHDDERIVHDPAPLNL